jgi:hypothetical protein
MGKLHTVFAWLVASTLGLVCALPHVTLADDSGPGREVRAIRHDLPILLRGSVEEPQRSNAPKIIVTNVTVSGTQASATWTIDSDSAPADYHGTLERRYDRWWLISIEWVNALTTPASANNEAQFRGANVFSQTLGGYRMSITFAPNDASSATLSDIQGRGPTEAESWITRGGNSYFFFSGTVQSTAPVHVQAGTIIDVWFPFVLDDSLHYAITIGHADKPIGPIDGTLQDNVVHFVLPAFALPPGATLMAEVEGDSFRHE